jgi:hypothetical protein
MAVGVDVKHYKHGKVHHEEGAISPAFNPQWFHYTLVVPDNVAMITVQPTGTEAEEPVKWTVPVAVLSYGGGPFTLTTLDHAKNQPVIVVKGSERMADILYAWTEVEKKKQATTNQRALNVLATQQLLTAEESLRRDHCATRGVNYADVAKTATRPPWWNVDSSIGSLQRLGMHKQLQFFDLGNYAEAFSMHHNPLLNLLLANVFRSHSIKDVIKFYMSLRCNKPDALLQIFKNTGFNIVRSSPSAWVEDGRLLVWAAFHDHGRLVDVMIDNGFELQEIDNLAILEMQRELYAVDLSQPPDWYAQEQDFVDVASTSDTDAPEEGGEGSGRARKYWDKAKAFVKGDQPTDGRTVKHADAKVIQARWALLPEAVRRQKYRQV